MREILRTEKLKKYFGEVHAVDEVDLVIEEGVLTSIIGPNGAGKTTLIHLITGSLRPDSGKVLFKGEDITYLPTHLRVKKGLFRSFQIMNIVPRLTVFQNILIPVLSNLNKSAKAFSGIHQQVDAITEAEAILRQVGLWEKKDLRAGQLSHGDQRLLELGIAIAVKPLLCLLDEPTAGMNPIERIMVLETIKSLWKGGKTTFVVIEHDMDVVFALSQRIVVMNRGKILADGKPEEVRENKEVRQIYLGEEV